MPELLDIHHGFNFRDLGGYRTTAGAIVAPKRLVRASKLADLSPRDETYLRDYGVVAAVDFRSPAERQAAPDRIPHGVAYHEEPVFAYDETAVSDWAAQQRAFAQAADAGYRNMVRTYADMITNPQSQAAYRQLFDLLLDTRSGAVLFHCSAGKDRTGMGAVFILAALGVPEATIRQDYLLTNRYVTAAAAAVVAQAKASGANANTQASLHDLWVARGAYLDSALATVSAHYGSLAHYLSAALDLTDAQVVRLRQLYLLPAAAD